MVREGAFFYLKKCIFTSLTWTKYKYFRTSEIVTVAKCDNTIPFMSKMKPYPGQEPELIITAIIAFVNIAKPISKSNFEGSQSLRPV